MITLVTSNPNKKRELAEILSGTEIDAVSLELPELQSMNLEEIVRAKVEAAFGMVKKPVIVEDVSFELGALAGFPGPFVKWWQQTAGYDRAAEIAKMAGDAKATVRCGAAYHDGARLVYVEGVISGKIVPRAGESGFGFDPYFMPDESDQTFAQMGPERKNMISHRFRCFSALREELRKTGIFQ